MIETLIWAWSPFIVTVVICGVCFLLEKHNG